MKFQEIQKLIQLLADSNVSELNIKEGEFEITIQKFSLRVKKLSI